MTKLIELHCHIEGAATPALVQQIAERNGLTDTLADVFDENGNWKWTDFPSFLKNYETAVSVFKTPADFRDLAYDYYSGIAKQDCIYAEIFVSPDCAELAGISYPDYIEALALGMEQAREDFGINGRMISIGIRHFGINSVLKAAATTVQHPHPLVAGFGIAGNELLFSIDEFYPAFKLAHDNGLQLTAHVGEHRGPSEIKKLMDWDLPVTRFGHGVRILDDIELTRQAIEQDIAFEVCPSSNVFMGLCDDIASHPIHDLHDLGAKITVSSDDPPHFHTNIQQEYEALAACGWTEQELWQASYDAIEASFCPKTLKLKLKKQLGASPEVLNA